MTSSPRRAGRFTATVMATAAHHRRRRRPSPVVLRLPADQMPAAAMERLRHPSAPAMGFLVRWDEVTMTAVWQPCTVLS